jgi:hypothetical protein
VWRVNKAIAREVLPTEPLDPRLEPWWVAHVVNLGEDCVAAEEATPDRTSLNVSLLEVHSWPSCQPLPASGHAEAQLYLLASAAGDVCRRGGVPVAHRRGAAHLPQHCGSRRAAGVRSQLQVHGCNCTCTRC